MTQVELYIVLSITMAVITSIINWILFKLINIDDFHGLNHRGTIKKTAPIMAILFPLWWTFIAICVVIFVILAIFIGLEQIIVYYRRKVRKRANRNRNYIPRK